MPRRSLIIWFVPKALHRSNASNSRRNCKVALVDEVHGSFQVTRRSESLACSVQVLHISKLVTPISCAGKVAIHDTPRTVPWRTTPRDPIDRIAATDRAALADGRPMVARIVGAIAHSAADGFEVIKAQFVAEVG